MAHDFNNLLAAVIGLAFARRQSLEPRPVDLAALVRGMATCCVGHKPAAGL